MISATLLGSYGSDRLIAEQAWMSTESHDETALQTEVEKVIKFLVRNRHTKPLEVVQFHFELHMPISIDRQFQTHRTQQASIANSGRYGSVPLEFYLAPNPGMEEEDYERLEQHLVESKILYAELLCKYPDTFGKNRTREILRDILPQGQMTKRRLTINLWAFAHLLKLRRSHHAQPEARQLAERMLQSALSVCPYTFHVMEQEGLLGSR
jgi:thymidylate synthase (FAD)